MSDEEKEAIEYIKNCLDDEYDFKNATRQKDKEGYNIILNMIEKQSKEIEHQIEKRANQKKELAILNAKQVEFNKLVNTVNSYKGQFKRQEKEIEELKTTKKELTERVLRLESDKFWDNVVSKDKIKAKIKYYKKIDNAVGVRILELLLEKE